MTHTPGPLHIEDASENVTYPIYKIVKISNGIRSVIATCADAALCDEHGGGALGNAYLIASAPALKASLREALKLLQWYRDNTRISPEVDIATGISMSFFYKAIEKSEGKHPVDQEGAL